MRVLLVNAQGADLGHGGAEKYVSELAAGLPLLAGDVVVATVWGLAGFALFQTLETQARRRGTLEGF